MKLQSGVQTAAHGNTECMYSFVQLGPNSSHQIQIIQLGMYSVVVQLSPNCCNFRESYQRINWHNLRQHNENRCYYQTIPSQTVTFVTYLCSLRSDHILHQVTGYGSIVLSAVVVESTHIINSCPHSSFSFCFLHLNPFSFYSTLS